jgi:formate-dependent nitrite reductase membrane component NrfD
MVPSGHPLAPNSSAAALLSYDVPHRMPWDWRVSLYTWTKSISAGSYLVAMLLVLAGLLPPESALWRFWAPAVALFFLGVTGVLLIADLTHPARFFLIFTRGQRKSWLVRGAYVIAGYGAVLVAHLASWASGEGIDRAGLHIALAFLGLPLSLLTAVYTAYLFAQAKARDLWQNPLLPAHFAVQAVLAGAAALLLLTAHRSTSIAAGALVAVLSISLLVHLLLVLGETTLTHSTAHAKLAAWELVRGRWRGWFWAGVLASIAALGLLVFGVAGAAYTLAALFALAGLFAYEHAYVQAGQSVPLA